MHHLAIIGATMTASTDNPLIEDHPADTLRNVECILSFLETFAATKDIPERHLGHEDYLGLFCILRCASDAIAYELPRIKTVWHGRTGRSPRTS